jgi:hypothetical protein
VNADANEGMDCDDGSFCTDDDTCIAGECSGDSVDCSDDNVCTSDDCDPDDDDGDPCMVTNNTMGCDDGNACTDNDICGGGTCAGPTAVVCDDGKPCTTDSCDMALGCQVVDNDAASCTDNNPCTIGDNCDGGECVTTGERNCVDSTVCTTDSCNVNDNDGDPCVHAPNTASCNDNNSCTATSVCGGGTCGAGGTPYDACGPNAIGCTAGTPNTCMCAANYVALNGTCVPNVNECETVATPCGPNTNCTDPSAASNNWVCTCRSGYAGGSPQTAGCTDINECAGNPCGAGRGTCAQNAAGMGYACTCGDDYTSVDDADSTVDPTCSCDLDGTFAIRIATELSWMNIENVENASGVVTYSWAIRQHTYDADGELTVVTTPCGGTTPDICNTLSSAAHAQYLPNSIWGTPAMPTETLEMNLPRAFAGEDFFTERRASLLGISLSDPMGAFPANRCNIGGWTRPGSSTNGDTTECIDQPITNGATFINHDSDSSFGVTSYAVPPGGIGAPPSSFAYGATSPSCPRMNAAADWAYDYWPGPDFACGLENLFICDVKRFYIGSRVISRLQGEIQDCDTITGTVQSCAGTSQCTDADGTMETIGRVGGCVRADGAGEAACSSGLTGFFDEQPSAQRVDKASFIIKRVTDTTPTCGEVRAMAF